MACNKKFYRKSVLIVHMQKCSSLHERHTPGESTRATFTKSDPSVFPHLPPETLPFKYVTSPEVNMNSGRILNNTGQGALWLPQPQSYRQNLNSQLRCLPINLIATNASEISRLNVTPA